MADIVSKSVRSRMMANIRPRGNRSTELAVATIFRRAGIKGWRRHLALPGRPDFTFPDIPLAVFVHGCFWHGCPRCYRKPTSNVAFWAAKVAGNRKRDRKSARQLRAKGYRVVTVWECELKNRRLGPCLARVYRALRQSRVQ